MATPAKTAAPLAQETPPADLGGRCDILPSSPLPELDSRAGPAFRCRPLKEGQAELYATVVTSPLPVRINLLSLLRPLNHPAMPRVVDWGTVDWAPESRRRFAVIFERPRGRRLMSGLDDMRDGLSEDHLIRVVIPPVLGALRELGGRNLSCGSIRPSNLFYKDPTCTSVVLGDFVTSLPGYTQPALFEPIERAMATPAGRGDGSVADDLYALGVTLLTLALGHIPMRGADNETVLQAKLDKGTFMALTGGVQLPNNLIEPLRGLTADDPRQRWSVNDLDLWLQGRRMTPKQPYAVRRGARPFEFKGKEIWHSRGLARALASDPAAAIPCITSGEVDKWVRYSLSDETQAEALRSVLNGNAAIGRTGNQEDLMVTRAVVALDPLGPLRYRGAAIIPTGLGPALAEIMTQGSSPQILAEIILSRLPSLWAQMQDDFRPEYVTLVQNLDQLRTMLEIKVPGYGIERVMYELNPTLPCASPLVEGHYVLTPHDLMVALNHASRKASHGREPMDRHIAAFIATHHRKVDERLLATMGTGGDAGRRIVAMLAILADVQAEYGPRTLPGLSVWCAALLDPALKRLKNRKVREKLRHEVNRLSHDGVLAHLLSLVDDPALLQKDARGFARAMHRYVVLTEKIRKLRQGIADQDGIMAGKGRQYAAAITSSLALGTLALTFFAMTGP